MSASRREYIADLLADCQQVISEHPSIHPQQHGAVIASLILADSLNGLRKALLQLQPGAVRHDGRRPVID